MPNFQRTLHQQLWMYNTSPSMEVDTEEKCLLIDFSSLIFLTFKSKYIKENQIHGQ